MQDDTILNSNNQNINISKVNNSCIQNNNTSIKATEGSLYSEQIKVENNNTDRASFIQENTHKKAMPALSFDKFDIMLAFFMLFIAFFGTKTFSIINEFDSHGIGISLFHISYCIFILFYAWNKEKNIITKEAIFWLISIISVALSYSFILNESISIYLSLFLRFSSIYYTFIILGGLNLKGTSNLFIIDLMNMYVLMPLKSLGALFICIFGCIGKNKLGHNLIKILLGIIIPIPLLALIIALLSSADSNFSLLIENILKNINENLIKNVFLFVFSIPAAIYSFSLAYGTKYKRREVCINLDEEKSTQLFDKFAIIPSLSLYSLLFIICTLYVIFIWLQGSYYTGAILNNLPESFTYAEYARAGFFQLCTVSVLNLSIIFISNILCKRNKNNKRPIMLTIFILTLIILTMFLIITAMAKMLMYINTYGLTALRIIPSIFMIWLFFVYIMLALNQFIKLNIVRGALLSLGCVLIILSFSNIDKIIAQYNINRYIGGTLEKNVLESSTIAWLPVIDEKLTLSLSNEKPEIYDALYDEKTSLIDYSQYRLDYKDKFLSFNFERNKVANIK